jgi:hypothetical protein
MVKRLVFGAAFVVAAVLVAAVVLRAQPPLTAEDVLARSVAAHGGARLSSWRTMAITGTIEMEDRITYRAAYRLQAKAPDKLKVEQDMTVDRGGRYVYEYFLNGSQSWSRRNLIVGKADPVRLGRWLSQCSDVAYFAKHATAIVPKPDATADWMTKSANGYQVAERRPAYVVSVTTDTGTADLYIDKTSYYLLQETTTDSRRLYSGFREFAGATHPTRILEITKGRNGADVVTPITYDAIVYDTPIEDWVFEEDMPKSGVK